MEEYSDQLLTKLEKLNSIVIKKVAIEQIIKAICYDKNHHADQKRDTGEPISFIF